MLECNIEVGLLLKFWLGVGLRLRLGLVLHRVLYTWVPFANMGIHGREGCLSYSSIT